MTMEILEVEHAQPVRVSKNKAGEKTSEEGITDPKTFLRERDPHRLLDGVYTKRSRTMFRRYYGPIEPTGGRVWIDRQGSHTQNFKYVAGELKQTDFWTRNAEAIFTFSNQLYGDFAPEGPTTEEQAIQSYRDKFILLASEIAYQAGGQTALDICFDFTQLVPEDLYREGYEDIKWIKGDLGERKGFGQDLVRGSKGSSIVYLESAGNLVPWSTIVHTPMTKISSARVLTDFIKEEFLWF